MLSWSLSFIVSGLVHPSEKYLLHLEHQRYKKSSRGTTLGRPICRSLNIDDDLRVRWCLPVDQVALHKAAHILSKLKTILNDKANNTQFEITAQIAVESCSMGKSSERKCLIVTLSARVAQSTRRGVPLL